MKKPSGFGDDVILFDLHAWCVSVFGAVQFRRHRLRLSIAVVAPAVLASTPDAALAVRLEKL
jgi:hypothetical protein